MSYFGTRTPQGLVNFGAPNTQAIWGGVSSGTVIGIALMLGFSDTERLREFSYPFIAQMLMFALLWGLWFDQLVAALLYWRDRRAMS